MIAAMREFSDFTCRGRSGSQQMLRNAAIPAPDMFFSWGVVVLQQITRLMDYCGSSRV